MTSFKRNSLQIWLDHWFETRWVNDESSSSDLITFRDCLDRLSKTCAREWSYNHTELENLAQPKKTGFDDDDENGDDDDNDHSVTPYIENIRNLNLNETERGI